MTQTGPRLRIKLRLEYDSPLILGPGKAELLARIGRLGSISAAAREMGMSYKRAWTLVEEMNTAFADPVIDSARGGAGGGGATVTPTGQQVLALPGAGIAVAGCGGRGSDGAERAAAARGIGLIHRPVPAPLPAL